MISHKHKCIFIHIPKTAGSSINRYFLGSDVILDWKTPNYEILYGWCPKRKIHLQHATSKQLIETELVTESQWNSYFKFTFVRNPWDRAYSDYLWIMMDRQIKGSFKDYIKRSGNFSIVLNDNTVKEYRGDHLISQTDFFFVEGKNKLDFIGRFESFQRDIDLVSQKLGILEKFNIHEKKNIDKKTHYSYFYTKSKKQYVNQVFKNDIEFLDYKFEDNKKGILKIKNFF